MVEDASLNAPRTAGQANGTAFGKTLFNSQTGEVDIRIPSLDNKLMFFAHEQKHAFQFDQGTISILISNANGMEQAGGANYMGQKNFLAADRTDETEAYARGAFFGQNTANVNQLFPHLPTGPINANNLTQTQINNIHIWNMATRISTPNGQLRTIH